MMRKKKDTQILNQNVNFPIYTVDGDKHLNESVNTAMELQFIIQNLFTDLFETQKNLEVIENKLNFYVNNIIKLPFQFYFQADIINFFDDGKFCIYSSKEINKIMVKYQINDLVDILQKLPVKRKKYQFTIKQLKKYCFLVNEYVEINNFIENVYNDLDFYMEQYNDLIIDVKKVLSRIIFFEIDETYSQIPNVESFNNRKHELLITMDETTKKWKWIYVNKRDCKKIVDIIDQNKYKIFQNME